MADEVISGITYTLTPTTLCEGSTIITSTGPATLGPSLSPYTTLDSTGEIVLELLSEVPQSASDQPGVFCNRVLVDPFFTINTNSVETILIGPGPTNTFLGLTTTFPTTTPSSTAFETPVESSSSAGVSSSSSHKNIAGPIVGSILGALVIAALAGWLTILRRRQQRRANEQHEWSRAPGKWSFGAKRDQKSYELNQVTSP